MSYILDALRKSEHERQIAAGQGVGMLHPIEIQRERKRWIPIGIVVVVTMITSVLIGWMWSHPAATEVARTIEKPVITIVSQPSATYAEVLPEPKLAPEVKKLIPVIEPKKIRIPTTANIVKASPSESKELPQKTTSAVNTDPLKDLPALSITGYIHNSVSGNLAMINNQLVHEGDEVSPGLRLVKILNDSAIFSYKGFVFSRQ
ncbi:MAG: GspB domain-containing protein [Gallionella sp.]|nr:GspB domain-containing protein [Gallionella sp.]